MTSPKDPRVNPVQPPLAESFARYLLRQAAAHAAGLAPVEATGEVVPYEAVPVQPVDPRLAWDGATAALHCFQPGPRERLGRVPPEWATLVAGHEPAVAVPFCVGNFPQLVRDLHALLHAADLSGLRPAAVTPALAPTLREWAAQTEQQGSFPQLLVVLGVLRLGRQFEPAAELVQCHEATVPPEWRAAWANEAAALAWQRGQADAAVAMWEAQAPSAPVHFNRGMARLFRGKPTEARPLLTAAVAQLPEENGWHHLGRLYLALAEMRA
jgi:hypothetical protein